MIADASMTDGLGIWYGEFGYAGEVVELLLVGFFFFCTEVWKPRQHV